MAPRKNKGVGVAKAAKRAVESRHDLAIEERLAGCGRGEAEHIIYLRNLVEKTLRGEFGAVLKALTVGRVSSELHEGRTSGASSDRILGRIEMCDVLWNDLEQYVIDGDKLLKPSVQAEDAPVSSYNYSPE